MKVASTLVLLFVCAMPAWAQFREVNTDLTATVGGALSLADFDADGRLDILIVGDRVDKNAETILYRNDGFADGTLRTTATGAAFEALSQPSIAPGDYDNDGDLDLLLTGRTSDDRGATFLYRNNGNFTFEQVNAVLPGLDQGGTFGGYARTTTAWGDYDNDGDLDLLLSGVSSITGETITRIYRNDGAAGFDQAPVALPALIAGSVSWGDYDNDGDLDVLVSSAPTNGSGFTRIYRNDGTDRFTDIRADLPAFSAGSVSWGDYDSDGDLDVLVLNAGAAQNGTVQGLYRNDGAGAFAASDVVLPNAVFGTWADFDNDGTLDLLHASINTSGILRNADQNLITPLASFPGLWFADLAVADLDADGRLDVLTMGDEFLSTGAVKERNVVRLYQNETATLNARPDPPSSIRLQFDGDDLVVLWEPGQDAETDAQALTYNLTVGTAPGLSDVMSAGITADGRALQPGPGNMGHARRTVVRSLDPAQPYFVRVQSVDSGFRSSDFARASINDTGVSTEPEIDQPTAPRLLGNYPNPFNPTTSIQYQLHTTTDVRLTVYDVLGNEVAVLVEGMRPAGTYEARWDGRDAAGRAVASGVYLYRLEAGTFRRAQTMTLLK
ncbi:MAG: FG-GAP-like repeat-containing protein [Bacteroidota bacterium]